MFCGAPGNASVVILESLFPDQYSLDRKSGNGWEVVCRSYERTQGHPKAGFPIRKVGERGSIIINITYDFQTNTSN